MEIELTMAQSPQAASNAPNLQGEDITSDASEQEDDTRGLLHQAQSQPRRSPRAEQANTMQSSAQRQELVEEDEELAEELAYTAAHVTSILKPVTLTMFLVVLIVKATEEQLKNEHIQSPYLVYRENDTDNTGTRAGKAIVNALVIVGAVLCFTVVFFFLYKYRCMKILYGWLGFSVAMLLGFSGGALFYTLIISIYAQSGHSWFPAIDEYSFLFIQYNFAVMGVSVVFWKSPLFIKQIYLVIASCIMAWVLSRFFPEWTVWALLAALSLYDIFAVLSPCGPLKALVELSQDRGDSIPGLIYEAAAPERRAEAPEAPLDAASQSLLNNAESGGEDSQPPVSEQVISNTHTQTAQQESLRQRRSDGSGEGSARSSRSEGGTEGAREAGVTVQGANFGTDEEGDAGASGGAAHDDSAEAGAKQTGPDTDKDKPAASASASASARRDSKSRSRAEGDKERAEGAASGGGGREHRGTFAQIPPSSRPAASTHVPTTPLGGSHVSLPNKPTAEDDDDRGVKLGLGDFVFYSVLVGRAAVYDLTTVVTCFYAILTGLIVTLFCLAVFRKALPALPFSIFFGIFAFFLTKMSIMPFLAALNSQQLVF